MIARSVEDIEHRLAKRRERRCFWRWPFGHYYGVDRRACLNCGRKR